MKKTFFEKSQDVNYFFDGNAKEKLLK